MSEIDKAQTIYGESLILIIELKRKVLRQYFSTKLAVENFEAISNANRGYQILDRVEKHILLSSLRVELTGKI